MWKDEVILNAEKQCSTRMCEDDCNSLAGYCDFKGLAIGVEYGQPCTVSFPGMSIDQMRRVLADWLATR